jgi:hypothetical protein
MAGRIRRARLAAGRAMAIGRRLVISRSLGPTGTFWISAEDGKLAVVAP